MAAECGLGHINIKEWIEPVRTVHRESGEKIEERNAILVRETGDTGAGGRYHLFSLVASFCVFLPACAVACFGTAPMSTHSLAPFVSAFLLSLAG